MANNLEGYHIVKLLTDKIDTPYSDSEAFIDVAATVNDGQQENRAVTGVKANDGGDKVVRAITCITTTRGVSFQIEHFPEEIDMRPKHVAAFVAAAELDHALHPQPQQNQIK